MPIRAALRRLKNRPGFSAAAILALALGIGCTTAMFSVAKAVLLRTLPVPHPDALLSVYEEQPGYPDSRISGPDFRDLRAQQTSFEAISALAGMRMRLTGLAHPEVAPGFETDGEFFRVLQAAPALGRLYGPGSAGEVVLSHALWKRVFGGDAAAVGRTISINNEPHTIVGVLGPGLEVPADGELWVSATRELPAIPGFLEGLTDRDSNYLEGIARLRPGVTLARARGELDALSKRLAVAYPDSNEGHHFLATSLTARIVGDAREPLFLLLGGVVLVLLIAIANVSGLQLARGAAGERDLAIRAALGASRRRLIQQLLGESTVLALCGGLLGVIFSYWGVQALVGLAGSALPRGAEVGLDGAVLAFAVGLSVLAGIASGLVPALLASRPDALAALRSAVASPGHRHARIRSALVAAEVALAVVLLTGAALLIQSFARLRAVEPGFKPEGVLAVQLSHAEQGAAEFQSEVARRVATIPGVRASGAILRLPLGGRGMGGDITPEGRPPHTGDFMAGIEVVTGDYFQAMGIPLLHGRALSAEDRKGAKLTAVVNQAFARRFFPGQDALGKRFCYGVADAHTVDWIEIVGIIGDVRAASLASEPQPEAYYPIGQAPTPPVEMTLVARTGLPLPAFLQALRSELSDPDQPLAGARSLPEVIDRTLRGRRLSMALLSVFSGCALLLAVLGIYATLAWSVAQRTREIGVRMALGARARTVVWLVIQQGMVPTLIGAAIGIGCALSLGRVLAGLLFGVGAHDPTTFAPAASVLLLAALAGCWLPARRAARVDPQVALRSE